MHANEVQRTDRGGIPVFWAPAPGAFRAAAMFRVGDGDERLPERGITHLVEHLALFQATVGMDDVNGFVSLDRCVLHAAGDREEVLAWLERCATALAALPLERLDAERRILGIEEESSGGAGPQALLGRVLLQRFGARGPGLTIHPQVGLRWLGPDRVAAWAGDRFTRADVAVWMTGEPPDELMRALPAGERHAQPPVEPLPGRGGVLIADEGTPGAATLAGLGARGAALRAAVEIAGERLMDRLRRELAIVYAPVAVYEALGSGHAHVLLGAECSDAHAPTVLEEVRAIAESLSRNGPTTAELDAHRRRVRRSFAEPDAILGALGSACERHLDGLEPRSLQALAAETEALEPSTVAEALAAALREPILTAAPGTPAPDGFRLLEPAFAPPVDGVSYDELPGGTGGELRVGDRGLTLRLPGEPPATALWDDLVLVERGPGEHYVLHSVGGTYVVLGLINWDRFADLQERVVGRIPDELVVPTARKEAVEAVDRLAAALPDQRAVGHELSMLPGALHDAERLEALLPFGSAPHSGLLSVTSERLLCWFLAPGAEEMAEVRRSDVRAARVRRRPLRPARLEIDCETPFSLDVKDPERAAEVARLIAGA